MQVFAIVFISQLLFNILKVLEIKFTFQNKTTKLLVNSVLLNLVSLLGVYYSLDALLNENYTVIVFYILGSVLGKWVGMKWDVTRTQKSLSRLVKLKIQFISSINKTTTQKSNILKTEQSTS